MYTVQEYKLSYIRERSLPATAQKRTIANKAAVLEFVKQWLSESPIENICIIALDSSNRIIGFTTAQGIANQCVIYPQQVFGFLLSTGAPAFIVAHNHPGGGNPSEADWSITARLYKAGKLLDIQLLDHIVIADEQAVSMRENYRWQQM